MQLSKLGNFNAMTQKEMKSIVGGCTSSCIKTGAGTKNGYRYKSDVKHSHKHDDGTVVKYDEYEWEDGGNKNDTTTLKMAPGYTGGSGLDSISNINAGIIIR